MINKWEARAIVLPNRKSYSLEMFQTLGMWQLSATPKTKTYTLASFGLNFLLRKLGKDIMRESRIPVSISASQSNLMISKFAT